MVNGAKKVVFMIFLLIFYCLNKEKHIFATKF